MGLALRARGSARPRRAARAHARGGRRSARRRRGAGRARRGRRSDAPSPSASRPRRRSASRCKSPTSTNVRAIEVVYRYRLDDAAEGSARPRAGMVVPLRAGDQALGSLAALSRSSSARFFDGAIDALEGIGRRAGPALVTARRFAEARQHAELDVAHRPLQPPRLPRRAAARGRPRAALRAAARARRARPRRLQARQRHCWATSPATPCSLEVGRRILSLVRATDIACRFGGDEFAVILPESSRADAELLAGRIVSGHRRQARRQGRPDRRVGRRRRAGTRRPRRRPVRPRRRRAVPREGRRQATPRGGLSPRTTRGRVAPASLDCLLLATASVVERRVDLGDLLRLAGLVAQDIVGTGLAAEGDVAQRIAQREGAAVLADLLQRLEQLVALERLARRPARSGRSRSSGSA